MTQVTTSRAGSPYLRPQGAGDTYDKFDGVGLAGSGAGRFDDSFHTSEDEQVKTTREAARRVKSRLAATKRFRSIEVGPEATKTTTVDRKETFKGVTLFNRWRIGRYEITEKSETSTSYNVSAEIPVGGGSANTNMKIAEIQSGRDSRQGWYFFD